MSVTKRSSKVVSYNERDDDDDDFISIVDHSKKNRRNKSNEPVKTNEIHEEKCMNRAPPLSKQEEPNKPQEAAIIENDQQESGSSQSSVSSHDHQTSPKNKRLKHDEDHTNENEDERMTSRDCSNLSKRNASGPLGFPTSKINIPSPYVSRVGLSRKPLSVKPLHPNVTSRVVHE